MKGKQLFKKLITGVIIFVTVVSLLPMHKAESAAAKKYLVLTRDYDGTYKLYDDMILETSNKQLMIKAKPIAEALGMTYRDGNGSKSGCVISYYKDKLIFTRNSRTFIYNQNGITIKRTAAYKQCIMKSYSMIHYKALKDLISCSYYDAKKASDYVKFGFSGVIIYDFYNLNPKLPKASEVFGTKVKPITEKVTPIDVEGEKHFKKETAIVYATLSIKNATGTLEIDLKDVLAAYKKVKLPDDGIYGYGYCDNDVTIQAINKKGKVIGEINTGGKGFPMEFQGAEKLNIKGNIKNIFINFTPVKPIVITKSVTYAISDINWLSPDGYARQYFVIPPYTRYIFYSNGKRTVCNERRQVLKVGSEETGDNVGAYQSIEVLFDREPKEFMEEDKAGIEFEVQ